MAADDGAMAPGRNADGTLTERLGAPRAFPVGTAPIHARCRHAWAGIFPLKKRSVGPLGAFGPRAGPTDKSVLANESGARSGSDDRLKQRSCKSVLTDLRADCKRPVTHASPERDEDRQRASLARPFDCAATPVALDAKTRPGASLTTAFDPLRLRPKLQMVARAGERTFYY